MAKYIKGDNLSTYVVTISFNDIEFWYVVSTTSESAAAAEALKLAGQDLFVVDVFDYGGTVEFHADADSEKEYLFEYGYPEDENEAIDWLLAEAAADLTVVNIEQVI